VHRRRAIGFFFSDGIKNGAGGELFARDKTGLVLGLSGDGSAVSYGSVVDSDCGVLVGGITVWVMGKWQLSDLAPSFFLGESR
jgi:hypothetical protein